MVTSPDAGLPPWFEPRLPSAAECSIARLLEDRTQRDPSRALFLLENGVEWDSATTLRETRRLAAQFHAYGVKPADRILLWLPTGGDFIRATLAAAMLGAAIVPLNPALRGAIAGRLIAQAEARLFFAHPTLLERLPDLPAGMQVVSAGAQTNDVVVSAAPPARENGAHDIAAILFSSGTTGPAKGVCVPFAQIWTLANVFYGYMNRDDRMLLMYPLHHIAGLSALYATLIHDASAAPIESFRSSAFWDVVARTSATTTPGLGPSFIHILNAADPRETDARNTLRHVNVQSASPAARAFAARFACSVMASYSMTETSGIAVSEVNPAKDGAVGRPRRGVRVRIVDAEDRDVAAGESGELILQAEPQGVLNAGYFGDANATERAWRGGWFHTGDVMRQDADGDLFFVDRLKDVIRRRSENISSSEVEAEARAFDGVQDAAAIGVPDGDSEEILLVVSPFPGATLDPETLARFLIPRMPHFMVPRYFRVVPDLPKTNTNRVQKFVLRQQGLTPDTWDREAAGLRLRGERLG